MKTLHFIIIIGIGAVTLTSLTYLTYSNQQQYAKEKIALYSFNQEKIGYANISELEPNNEWIFFYPDQSDPNFKDNYHIFLLIRLPLSLGGGANDTSAFRAYNAVDLSSHCTVRYWPMKDRMRIEDPCSGNMYRAYDGYMITRQDPLLGNNLALPIINLSSDKDGHIYAEPPVFTDYENGALGIGRKLSSEKIQQASNTILALEQQWVPKKFDIPDHLAEGYQINRTISSNGLHWLVMYQNPVTKGVIYLHVDFCQCINYDKLLDDMKYSKQSKIWKFGNQSILAYPTFLSTISGTQDSNYFYTFYKNTYRIQLTTPMPYEEGMKIVLETFFPGKKITDLIEII